VWIARRRIHDLIGKRLNWNRCCAESKLIATLNKTEFTDSKFNIC